jgi:hypothetical protein
VRPRRLAPGDAFTWRFKTKDYWQAVGVPGPIKTVEELMALHEPWVTSSAPQVLSVVRNRGGEMSLDDEGLIVVDIEDSLLGELNSELEALGCTLSNELLHTL